MLNRSSYRIAGAAMTNDEGESNACVGCEGKPSIPNSPCAANPANVAQGAEAVPAGSISVPLKLVRLLGLVKKDGVLSRASELQAAFRLLDAAQSAPTANAAQPVAWLVTGGKKFVDRAFITEAHADKSIAERRDGAHKVPLGRIDASASGDTK